MSLKPQARAILELLIAAGSDGITAHDALREAGCFRLAARVAELRAAGYDVRTLWESDGLSRYARYVYDAAPLFVATTGEQQGLAL